MIERISMNTKTGTFKIGIPHYIFVYEQIYRPSPCVIRNNMPCFGKVKQQSNPRFSKTGLSSIVEEGAMTKKKKNYTKILHNREFE